MIQLEIFSLSLPERHYSRQLAVPLLSSNSNRIYDLRFFPITGLALSFIPISSIRNRLFSIPLRYGIDPKLIGASILLVVCVAKISIADYMPFLYSRFYR